MTPGLEHLVHSVVWKGAGEAGLGYPGVSVCRLREMQMERSVPTVFLPGHLLDIWLDMGLASTERIPFFCKFFERKYRFLAFCGGVQ